MASNLLQKLKSTRVPNSYYFVMLLAVASVLAVAYGVSISGQKKAMEQEQNMPENARQESYLSRKVSDITLGMSRNEVIRRMGLPDWAVVWGDDGVLSTPDPEIALELRWKNPECREISVMFSPENDVIGWDDGANFCNAGLPMEDREQYACTQPDRQQYCR